MRIHLILLACVALATSAFFIDCGGPPVIVVPPPQQATLHLAPGNPAEVVAQVEPWAGTLRVGFFDWTLSHPDAQWPQPTIPQLPPGWACSTGSSETQLWVACFTADSPLTIEAGSTFVLGKAGPLPEGTVLELAQLGDEFGNNLAVIEWAPPATPTPTKTPDVPPTATPGLPTVVVNPPGLP